MQYAKRGIILLLLSVRLSVCHSVENAALLAKCLHIIIVKHHYMTNPTLVFEPKRHYTNFTVP